MATCRTCNQEGLLGSAGVCETCRGRLGIPYRTEPLRPRTPCVRCGGASFVRSRAVRERAASGGDHSRPYLSPLAVSFVPSIEDSFWSGTQANAEKSRPVGFIEAYVCRGCGFTELYTQGAADIPIGDEFGTELFELLPGAGPFR